MRSFLLSVVLSGAVNVNANPACTAGIDLALQPLALPTPPCPSECNGGCEFGVCLIDRTPVACPAGWPCHIVCTGGGACENTVFQCNDDKMCKITCLGGSACDFATFNCGEPGCVVYCAGGGACEHATVNCGTSDNCAMIRTGAGQFPPQNLITGPNACSSCLNDDCPVETFCRPLFFPLTCGADCDECTPEGVCVKRCEYGNCGDFFSIDHFSYTRVDCVGKNACDDAFVSPEGFLELNCIGQDSCTNIFVGAGKQGAVVRCLGAGSCSGAYLSESGGPTALECGDGNAPRNPIELYDRGCHTCVRNTGSGACATLMDVSISTSCADEFFAYTNEPVCAADSGFPDTPIGDTATLQCPPGQIGERSRTCNGGIWSAVRSTCSNFVYTGDARPGSSAMANAQQCSDACAADPLCVAHSFWNTGKWCKLLQTNTGTTPAKSGVSGLGSPVCTTEHVNAIYDETQAGVTVLSRHTMPSGRNDDMCCELCESTPSCVAFSFKWKGKCLLFSQVDPAAPTKSTSQGSFSGLLV